MHWGARGGSCSSCLADVAHQSEVYQYELMAFLLTCFSEAIRSGTTNNQVKLKKKHSFLAGKLLDLAVRETADHVRKLSVMGSTCVVFPGSDVGEGLEDGWSILRFRSLESRIKVKHKNAKLQRLPIARIAKIVE